MTLFQDLRLPSCLSGRRYTNARCIAVGLALCVPGVLALRGVRGDAPVESANPEPSFSGGKGSYTVPFARPVDFRRLGGLSIRASLNGGKPTSFLVDTGSVGIIVSADEVPNIDPNAPTGSIKYSSSGLELDGVWTKTTVTFPDSKDANGHVVAAVVPVLAVTSEKMTGTGVNAITRPSLGKPHPHMFGIGFGRGAEAHPERNPFLNLIEMQAGTMHRGYTITRHGYTLGLTPKSAGSGYVYQKLKERAVPAEIAKTLSGLKDWGTAPGSLTVGTTTAPMGTVLVDTGLTNMMLAIPGEAAGEVAPGTEITINLLSDRLHYSFKVGDMGNPATPRRVTKIRPTRGTFVNTGLRALYAFDYLFDADGGYLGLRSVKAP